MSSKHGCAWTVLWVWVGLGAPLARAAPLTVEEAVARVAHAHPEVLAARASAAALTAAADSGRGRLLPAFTLSDKQFWTLSKVGSAGFVGPAISGLGLLAGGSQMPSDFSINLLQVGAAQPILGLVQGGYAYAAVRQRAAAAHMGARRQQEVTQAQVQVGYLQLFEARALRLAAAEAHSDLQEQANLAQRKVEAGSLTQADVLRVRVAAAEAQQQVIAASGQEATLQAALTEMLDLGDGDGDGHGEGGSVAFAPPESLLQDSPPAELAASREAALRQRLDLRQSQALAQAAQRSARAKGWSLMPELNFMAAYAFTAMEPIRGSQAGGYLQLHAGIFGLALDWPIWEWGRSWYAVQEARAEARSAHFRHAAARQGVATEVASRHHALASARAAIEVSALQVEAAAEAYRVVRELTAVASATTSDLLDAQSALTGARTRHVQNRYQAAVARVALELASSSRAPAADGR